jgi:hypothetical protein
MPPSGLKLRRYRGTIGGTLDPLELRQVHVDTQPYGNAPGISQPSPGPCIFAPFTLQDAMTLTYGDKLFVLVTDRYDNNAALRLFRITGITSPNFNVQLASSTAIFANWNHLFFGSLGHDDYAGWWIGGNCSGPNLPISACLTRIAAGNAPAAQGVELVKRGTTVYYDYSYGGLARFGDYTSIATDAQDGRYVWFSAQAALDPSFTRTWVMQVHKECSSVTRTCPAPAPLGSAAAEGAVDESGLILDSPIHDSEVLTPPTPQTAEPAVVVPDVPAGMTLPGAPA